MQAPSSVVWPTRPVLTTLSLVASHVSVSGSGQSNFVVQLCPDDEHAVGGLPHGPGGLLGKLAAAEKRAAEAEAVRRHASIT